VTADLNNTSGATQSSNLAGALLAGKTNPAAYTAITSSNLAGQNVTLSNTDGSALLSVLSLSTPLPVIASIPNASNEIPAPTTSGSYYIPISKDATASYTIAGTTDTISSDGTGKHYFNGVLLIAPSTITLSTGVKMDIAYLGSIIMTPHDSGVVCFLGHAPVATPTGPKRIDSLKEGDLVLTEAGKAVPIQRVKVMRCRPGPTTNPYVISKGSFGATEELLISPRHKVAVGDAMIEARDLDLQQKAMKAPFNYYNIELPGWANMRVAGVIVESLAPAKRVVATLEQVQAAIAALPASQKTAETLKTLKRICQKTADGKIMVFGSTK
jgi:hypothetical protein